jgi:hypothetical protein
MIRAMRTALVALAASRVPFSGPWRPKVDRMVLSFLKSEALHPADFTIREDGVVLARRVTRLAAR